MNRHNRRALGRIAGVIAAPAVIIPAAPSLVLPERPALVRADASPDTMQRLFDADAARRAILPGMMGGIVGAAGAGGSGPPAVSLTGSAGSTSDLSSYTFSSVSIGTPSSDRYIAVLVTMRSGSPSASISVTVGGQATSEVVRRNTSATSIAIYITSAPVTSGSTANVVVSLGAAALNCAVAVFAITGIASNTAVNTQSTATNGATMSLSNTAGGIAIGGAIEESTATFTVAGLTENLDTVIEAGQHSQAAASLAPTAGGSLSVSFTSTGVELFSAVCASFF